MSRKYRPVLPGHEGASRGVWALVQGGRGPKCHLLIIKLIYESNNRSVFNLKAKFLEPQDAPTSWKLETLRTSTPRVQQHYLGQGLGVSSGCRASYSAQLTPC